MQTYAKKTPVENYFIYLGNKEIYCIFRHAAQSVLLPKCRLLKYFIFFFCSKEFFIKHVLKFKYQATAHLEVTKVQLSC